MSKADRPQDVVEAALAVAAGAGQGVEAAVVVEEESSVNLRWAMNGMTTNGLARGRSVTAVVTAPVEGGRGVGVLTRTGVGVGDVADLVAEAKALAAAGSPAEDAAALVEGGAGADWDEEAVTTGAPVLAEVAAGLGEVLASSGAQGREAFGFALHELTTTWLGTSAGTRHRHVQPRGTIELTGKSHGRTRSTWVGRGTRDFSDVDVLALDAEVRRRLDWQARTVGLPPGRYDTILPPEAVADFMIYLYWSADARSAHEGRSVLSRPGGGTRAGESVSALPWRLWSDPTLPGLECDDVVVARSSSPFASVFDNGLLSPAQTWLDGGRLLRLPTTRHTAAMTGLPLAPAVDNLALDLSADHPSRHAGAGGAAPALTDPEHLLAGLSRGLLLTSMWYVREVDPLSLLLTGLTRDGVYLVEDGEVAAAVPNFRFNVSPMDLLTAADAVGASRAALSREWGEYFTRTSMPSLRVRGFNMSSVSEAS